MSPTASDSIESALPLDSNGECNSTEGVKVEINASNDGANSEEVTDEKKRRGTVSIDVTKALLLLGFTSWSGIETGKKIFYKFLIRNIFIKLSSY